MEFVGCPQGPLLRRLSALEFFAAGGLFPTHPASVPGNSNKSFRVYRCKVTNSVRMREGDDHFLEGQRIPTCQYKCSDPTSCLHKGVLLSPCCLEQCFSTAGPRPGTGTWHQLYRAARGSPGICNFSF